MKKVIATCITNDYDWLKEPEVDIEGWEFHCFTDNMHLTVDKNTVWQLHKFDGDNREVKMLTHKHLDYDVCLWVDASLAITNDLGLINNITNKHAREMYFFRHPKRVTPVQELKHCIENNRGDATILEQQLSDYEPKRYQGLAQIGVHLKLNKPGVNSLMERWYAEWLKYPSRDQPSFTSALHESGFKNYQILHQRVWDSNFSRYPIHRSGDAFEVRTTHPHVNWIQPFSSDKQYGSELNRIIDLLPDDEWIGITDQDVMWLEPHDKKTVEDCIKRYPDTQLFSGITNRLGLEYQLHGGRFDNDADVKKSCQIARQRKQKYGDTCKRIYSPIAGFMMVFPKYVWEQNKFIDGITTDNNLVGIAFFDWMFGKGVLEKGGAIRLMQGVYVFHCYRILNGGKNYVRHLM